MADCVPLVAHVIACFLIFCCLCCIMPKSRVCAKEQSFVEEILRDPLVVGEGGYFMSCVCWLCVARLAAIEGQARTRVVAMSVAVL